jgi:hypothetical protein
MFVLRQPVALIDEQLRRLGDHILVADDGAQACDQTIRVWACGGSHAEKF